jgi:glycine/D-amino acid oxidase-like deaminating enzyme/nitrite reductase/ring-hydroxylating ferredoxin subunit
MNQSLWLDTIQKKQFPKLEQDLKTQVLVVGAGITGISCAYELAKANYKVALVDANQLLHGTSGYTTSKLTIQHSLIYDYLLNKKGYEDAWLYKDINTKAIDHVKEISELHGIDCDYKAATATVYTNHKSHIKDIEREYEAAKELGIPCEYTTDLSLPYQVKAGLRFNNQAEFHVAKYLNGLIHELEKMNVEIYENTKVIKIDEQEHQCESTLLNNKTIYSDHVIMASHYPCHKSVDLYFTKLMPSFSYVMAFETQKSIDHDMIINMSKPIRSLRKAIYNNQEILLIAGESHDAVKTKNKEKHYQALYEYADYHFKVNKELYRWSNMDYSTTDQLPMIGHVNNRLKNVYIATGFGKWGMTKGVVASLVLRDLIVNNHSEYEALFDPCRFSSIFTNKFFSYNLKQPGKFIKSKMVKTIPYEGLEPNEQKTVRINNKNYGAYKDEFGETYVVDITCPHMKCSLRFNNAEKTYDCMCHGSRFNYKGEYLDGPSKHNLTQLNPRSKEDEQKQEGN